MSNELGEGIAAVAVLRFARATSLRRPPDATGDCVPPPEGPSRAAAALDAASIAPVARRRMMMSAGLILVGSAIVAFTTLLAKALGTDTLGPALSPFQISHGRFMFALIVILGVVAAMRPQLTRPAYPLHFARATCGWLTVTLLFLSASMIPLSDATAISFLSPIVTMALAAIFLRERVGQWRWTAAAISLAGAFVLLRPGDAALSMGALAALAAALTMGFEMTLIKRLTRTEPTIQILLMSNIFGTVLSSTAVIAVWTPPTPQQWAALAALGCLMLTAQFCWVQGMRLADASFAVPIAYTTLIFAALYDAAIFSVWPDWVSVLGAGLILSGAVLLTTQEGRRRRA
ncbi:MAG: DMT family transporter [Pseudomonadota bacterium]